MARQKPKAQGGSSNAVRRSVPAPVVPEVPEADSDSLSGVGEDSSVVVDHVVAPPVVVAAPAAAVAMAVEETIPKKVKVTQKNKRKADVALAEPVDSYDSEDSLAGEADKSVLLVKRWTRFVPPFLQYRAKNRTMSAGFALASALDMAVWFPVPQPGCSQKGGGVIVQQIRTILEKHVAGNIDVKKILLQRANNMVTQSLSPLYQYQHITSKLFNVLTTATTLPVVVLTNPNKYSGFAVCGNWIYDAKAVAMCKELNEANLRELGYFKKTATAAASPSVDDGAKKKGSPTSKEKEAEEDKEKEAEKDKEKEPKADPEVADCVKHYAVVMNDDWINKKVEDGGKDDKKPASKPNQYRDGYNDPHPPHCGFYGNRNDDRRY